METLFSYFDNDDYGSGSQLVEHLHPTTELPCFDSQYCQTAADYSGQALGTPTWHMLHSATTYLGGGEKTKKEGLMHICAAPQVVQQLAHIIDAFGKMYTQKM